MGLREIGSASVSLWAVLASGQRFDISESAQEALCGRLGSWAHGSWLIERLDTADAAGYEPSPDERNALINATNDVARSSAPRWPSVAGSSPFRRSRCSPMTSDRRGEGSAITMSGHRKRSPVCSAPPKP